MGRLAADAPCTHIHTRAHTHTRGREKPCRKEASCRWATGASHPGKLVGEKDGERGGERGQGPRVGCGGEEEEERELVSVCKGLKGSQTLLPNSWAPLLWPQSPCLSNQKAGCNY